MKHAYFWRLRESACALITNRRGRAGLWLGCLLLGSAAYGQAPTVTATSPLANARAAPVAGSAVGLTFSVPVAAATVGNIPVQSGLVGGRKAGTWSGGGTSSLSYLSTLPGSRADFLAGEPVQVTVPGKVLGLTGLPAVSQSYQFYAAAAGTGRGRFPAGPTVPASPVGSDANGLGLGDINNDGWVDLLVPTGQNGQVLVRLGTATPGVFATGTPLTGLFNPYSVTVADLNNDGNLDLAIPAPNASLVHIRLGTGTGTFSAAASLPTAPDTRNCIAADFNNDGVLDIAAASSASHCVYYFMGTGTGTGTFGASTRLLDNNTGASGCLTPCAVDLDGDGWLELVASVYSANQLVVFRNLGTAVGTFGAATYVPTGLSPSYVRSGDLDGDGRADLVNSDENATTASYLRNTSTGRGNVSFAPVVPIPAGGPTPYVALADVNADGTLDVVLTLSTMQLVAVATNNGAGVFTLAGTYPVGPVYGLEMADLDRDGDVDLVTNRLTNVAVRLNQPPLLAAQPGASRSVCAGQPTVLGAAAVAGYTYSWSPSTGLSSSTVANPTATLPNATAAPLTQTYTLTVTAPDGSTATGQVVVTVLPAPVVAAIAGPAVVCDVTQPQPYQVAGAAGITYQWTITGGTLTAGQGTPQVTVQFAPGAPAYAVRVQPTAATGCAGPAKDLAVSVKAATLALTVASVASADNTRIELNPAVLGAGSPGALVQVWRRVAGLGSFALVGTVPAAATAYTDAGVDAAAASYEYRLELPTACTTPVRSALVQTMRLEATATNGAGGFAQGTVALRWNAYVGFAVQHYQLYRRLDGGPWQLQTTVAGTVLQATTVNSHPTSPAAGAGFAQDFRVVAVATTQLQANSNVARVEFANPVRTYTVITPNGDAQNDQFIVDNLALYPGNTLHIFNRWGREVFATTNYQNNWGAGTDVVAGVYHYLLTLPNAPAVKGWVEVVK